MSKKKKGQGSQDESSQGQGILEPKDGYLVGYGKPPIHSRFKPGKSGNPKGPPKGARSFKSLLGKALDATIAVKSDGKRTKTTKRAAAATQIANAAARGDPKAIKLLMDMETPIDGRESTDGARQDGAGIAINEADARVLEHALERIKRDEAPEPPKDGEPQ